MQVGNLLSGNLALFLAFGKRLFEFNATLIKILQGVDVVLVELSFEVIESVGLSRGGVVTINIAFTISDGGITERDGTLGVGLRRLAKGSTPCADLTFMSKSNRA